MRVRHRHNGSERTVELGSRLDDYTVADLVSALDAGQPAGAGLRIDGAWHSPDTSLSSVAIWEGALLEVGQAPSPLRLGASSDGGSSAVLVVTAGLRAGTRLEPPDSGDWVIGRAPGCDLVLDDPAISRRHARVNARPANSDPVVTDLGSCNSTVVAGRAITEPTPVAPGVNVRLGATCVQWRRRSTTRPPQCLRASALLRDGSPFIGRPGAARPWRPHP